MIGQSLITASEDGSVLTHVTDSTTRKHVGTFAPSGIFVNKDKYFPLPTITFATESASNIAAGIKTTLDMVGAASGHTANELYAAVDLHMTDATAHNKTIPEKAAELMEREVPAGRLYDPVHTTLGFDGVMKKAMNGIEVEMKIDNISKAFLLDVSIDQTSDTVSFSFVSWVLSLFGPDKVQMPWNYHSAFCAFMKREGRIVHLFNLKDARFACLSRCAAIVLFHWEDFRDFLERNDCITNKLACLVRDAMELEYIRIVLAAVAAYGLQLISPFFRKTMGRSTHSELQHFFTKLYHLLKIHDLDSRFFQFDQPYFEEVSSALFDGIKSRDYYGEAVVSCIVAITTEHPTDCLMLVNLMRPEMSNLLSRQRGTYYGFGEHQNKSLNVFNQVENIDSAPTNNIQMERQCGDQDHRLFKKGALSATSQDNIIKYTTGMRNVDRDSSIFRSM